VADDGHIPLYDKREPIIASARRDDAVRQTVGHWMGERMNGRLQAVFLPARGRVEGRFLSG
jgi:hypothetical protein